MEFFQPFLAVFVILQESIKVFQKNGRLIALTIIPSLTLSSILLIVFNLSFKSKLQDILARETFLYTSFSGAFTPELASALSSLKQDFGILFVLEIAFFLASLIISTLSITAFILTSAISKTDRTLSLKHFALHVLKACIRPLHTVFYISLLGLGYFFFVLAIAAPIFMFSEFRLGKVPFSIILFGICAYVLYLYLSITWTLSLVVSVVEENCCGIEALGKAARLIKGKRLQGFMLSFSFAVFCLVASHGLRFITGGKWPVDDIFLWNIVLIFSYLVKMCVFVTYTVLYFHCKKHHGEEIELQRGAAEMYQKISNAPLVGDNMA